MRRRRGLTAMSTAIALSICASAHAQVPQILPPGLIWPTLTEGDFAQMHAAAALLYHGRPIGASERWRNPETQNAGSITLTRDFDMKGMHCHTMNYRIRFRHPAKQHDRYLINWCEVADGSWKIVDQQPIQ